MLKKLWSVAPLALLGLVVTAAPAYAQDGYEAVHGIMALSAGLAIAIAAACGALGQARGLAAAMDGIARNPSASGKLVTPMIIGLALIESLVIYALVIALMIVLKF
ncbi:MAG: ATP synthase F0 subunit C [Deferrisomatales bacterium]|nr:ATP synthase F0 subunit C [Deferrisomatales bacterium]